MRYVLNSEFRICGWDSTPYAVMDTRRGYTFPINEDIFNLLLKCNGKKDIDLDSLNEDEKKVYAEMLEKKIIHEAKDGEKRTIAYYDYPGVYKKDVQWSITGKCNYRCKHCFQSAPHGVLGQPTLEQCFDVIKQLDECGIRRISITGGEPLIRSDFFEIVDEILRRGMFITTIYSNGLLVTDKLLDEFEKRNIKPSFQISFDGVGYHDWMRGVEGAEKYALDAFKRLKDRGFYTASAMCLCKENISSIRETVLKLAEVGCSSLKFQRVMPMGEWENQKEHYLTYDETLQAYLDYLPYYKEDGMPLNIQMEGYFAYSKDKGGYINLTDREGNEEQLAKRTTCGVIQNAFYIGPNGVVAPCMSMNSGNIESILPNVFKTPLREILTNSEYTKLVNYRVKDVFDHNEKCHDCKYRCQCCSGCRAFATGQNGTDFLAIDEVTCHILCDGWADKLDVIASNLFEKAYEKTKNEAEEC